MVEGVFSLFCEKLITFSYANIKNLTDLDFHDPNKKFPNGSVTIRINLDEITKKRFEIKFGYSQRELR